MLSFCTTTRSNLHIRFRYIYGCELREQYVPTDIVYKNHHFTIDNLEIYLNSVAYAYLQYQAHSGQINL